MSFILFPGRNTLAHCCQWLLALPYNRFPWSYVTCVCIGAYSHFRAMKFSNLSTTLGKLQAQAQQIFKFEESKALLKAYLFFFFSQYDSLILGWHLIYLFLVSAMCWHHTSSFLDLSRVPVPILFSVYSHSFSLKSIAATLKFSGIILGKATLLTWFFSLSHFITSLNRDGLPSFYFTEPSKTAFINI